eukprot:scaffold192050_cov33-Tisochrysis_lutea.AAC.2
MRWRTRLSEPGEWHGPVRMIGGAQQQHPRAMAVGRLGGRGVYTPPVSTVGGANELIPAVTARLRTRQMSPKQGRSHRYLWSLRH